MKKILVPHDFSNCADHALNEAVYLADKIGAELHIYHVAPLHPYWKELSTTDQEAYKKNLETVHGVTRKLAGLKEQAEAAGVSVRTSFTSGSVIEQVAAYCRDESIDLLVLGTHGMSGIREAVIGSNTQKILRKVDCPVLAIKHDLVYREFNQVAFVSSFHEENEAPFHKILDFAAVFDAEIFLVNMDEPGFFSDPLLVMRHAMRRYQEIARSRGFKCSIHRIAGGNLEEGLKEVINEKSIDLVAIPTHGRGAIARIFSSSIAEAVVNHLDKPVMTIRMTS